MVIRAPRISRDPAVVHAGRRSLVVVPGQEEKSFRIREHSGGVQTPNGVSCKPGHIAMRAGLQPGMVFSGMRGGTRARELAHVEPTLLGKISNAALHGLWSPRNVAPEEFELQLPDE